jgi:hypothetical protein
MFGKLLSMLAIAIGITSLGCADPHYANAPHPLHQANENETPICEVQFKNKICLNIVWEKWPAEGEYGQFVLKTFRLDANNQSPTFVDLALLPIVTLWMPSMGHGSSPTVIERVEVGRYHVSRVYFMMKGEWEIRFQLKNGNEVQDQAVLPVSY